MRSMTSPLITPEELAAHLDDPGWVIVDCRFTLTDPAAGPATYARSHIPGARYANLDQDLSRRPGPSDGRHPLPAASDFAARLGAWGIDHSSMVVAYDEASGAIAARLWWLLGWLRPRSPPRARRRLRGVERRRGCRSSPGRRAGSRFASCRGPWPTTRSSRPRTFPRSRPQAICSSMHARRRATAASKSRSIRRQGTCRAP